ncbi:hypothetical protein GcM1_200043 [Golovinomyces cichoracearum]|uniref:Uncharacterized protein n=1 Tax=Golovinomyces cichoracearum TaxID=62708 RepID=A0A420IYZ9_9PEZI|nr:hypothetical protein GcM1_200043 [Golovinomyces cichoracearum]
MSRVVGSDEVSRFLNEYQPSDIGPGPSFCDSGMSRMFF